MIIGSKNLIYYRKIFGAWPNNERRKNQRTMWGGVLKTILLICKKCVDAWETFLFGTTDNFMFI